MTGNSSLNGKRSFALMVKPVGALCSMRCAYCYYLNTDIDTRTARMDRDLLETMIRSYIDASGGPVVSFTWHGGEPALAGLGFYREAVRLQKKYLPDGWECWNSLQTNGLALDDEWCAFLAENRFDVGISIDGTGPLHDRYRKDASGAGTYTRVYEAVQRLKRYGILPDLLCTVTEETAAQGKEVYRNLKAMETGWMQFIPIVVRDGSGRVSPVSVTPEAYGRFLKEVFFEWVFHDLGKTEVQLFSEMALVLSGNEANLCTMKETCGEVPVVERDGGVYACDHFVNRAHKIGDLTENSLEEITASGKQKAFGDEKRKLPGECLSCPYRKLCNGGCPKDRFFPREEGDETPGAHPDSAPYYLCKGYRYFFDYAVPRLKRVMELSSQRKQNEEIMKILTAEERAALRKLSRNDPCPCGSGLKYKNCCIRYCP